MRSHSTLALHALHRGFTGENRKYAEPVGCGRSELARLATRAARATVPDNFSVEKERRSPYAKPQGDRGSPPVRGCLQEGTTAKTLNRASRATLGQPSQSVEHTAAPMLAHTRACAQWAAAGVFVLPLLYFVSAPYGKFHRGGAWGPAVPGRVGWIVQELPSPLALLMAFSHPTSTARADPRFTPGTGSQACPTLTSLSLSYVCITRLANSFVRQRVSSVRLSIHAGNHQVQRQAGLGSKRCSRYV
jgi:hypothetical protein